MHFALKKEIESKDLRFNYPFGKMKLLVIDNYDSFTYNLVQYFGQLGASTDVFRNDVISIAVSYTHLTLPTTERV